MALIVRSERLAAAAATLDHAVRGTREQIDERDRQEILWWRHFHESKLAKD